MVAVGLVDQGSQGGGGKIWQRGRPSGGGGSRGGVGGSGVCGGVGGNGVDDSGSGVKSCGGKPVSASCGLASVAGRR